MDGGGNLELWLSIEGAVSVDNWEGCERLGGGTGSVRLCGGMGRVRDSVEGWEGLETLWKDGDN